MRPGGRPSSTMVHLRRGGRVAVRRAATGRGRVRVRAPARLTPRLRRIEVVFTIVGAFLVGAGTLLAAPELRKPLGTGVRTISGAIANTALAIKKRLGRKTHREVFVTTGTGGVTLSADRIGVVVSPDTQSDRWRGQVRDLLAKMQERLGALEANVEDHQVETVKALAELREELIGRIGAELEVAAATHVRSRMVGALLVILGTGLLAAAPFVGLT